MEIVNIRVAQNGFVLEDIQGNTHIARTLLEAAQISGEDVPTTVATVTRYAPGFTAFTLESVRRLSAHGEKINAIKELRNCFTPRLGLREAKEILDTFYYD